MKVQHHPSDALMIAYAAGTLAEGWSLAVATHLALCPHCRTRLAGFEAAAGRMLETLPGETTGNDDSWSDMLARLDKRSPETAPSKAEAPIAIDRPKTIGLLPQPLRDYVGADGPDLRWKAIGLGAYHINIPTEDGSTSVRLLRIPAGKPVPEHGHRGRELTLVLEGSFRDGENRFGRGDFEETDESVEHQPIADEGRDCICLAVTDAPLRFKSRLLRLVQPLLGI